MSAKAEVELMLPFSRWKNIFNVKYLENGKRYDVGVKRGQIGNQQDSPISAFDWKYKHCVVTEDGRTYLFTSADDNNVVDDMMMMMMMMCPRVSS